ncbi:MAG: hypothetical protein WBE58_24750 [Verrucomicrobiales bacterium]|nr:hypothetical protein [Verrucomicrobiales bacterium]
MASLLPHHQQPDHAVREMESACPRLRNDLRLRFQEFSGQPGYLLEDPVQGRFFRLGEREYQFVRALDGTKRIGQIVAQLAARSGGADAIPPLDESEAVSLFRSFADAGLIASRDSEHVARVADDISEKQESQQLLGKTGNVLSLRIPLGNPDRFFSWLARWFGWLAGPWVFLLWMMLLAAAGVAVSHQFARFSSETSGVFQVGNLGLLTLLWIGLKVWHECWHGLVCRRYGGEVPEAGMNLLLLITPLGYVNATSSLRFPSRWQRMHVAAAGMYGELMLAAIAAIWWARVEPGTLTSSALHQTVVVSGMTTLMFNANPLMRFDGYYIFSDLFGLTNLTTRSQQMTSWLTRRWLLGFRKTASPLWAGDRGWLIAIYGFASALWRFLVMIGLLVGAAQLFHGAGLVLALVAGSAILVRGIGGFVRLLTKARSQGASPWALGARLALLSLLVVSLLVLVRWHPRVSAPAVVQSASGGEVRADCPGFLDQMTVIPGQPVRAGETLAVLKNVEQTSKLRRAEIDVALSRLRKDQFQASDDIAACQAEAQNLKALEAKYAELQTYTSTLNLKAPRDGIVIGRDLESLAGTWIEPGHLVMLVGNPAEKELVILAPQAEMEVFQKAQVEKRPAVFAARGRSGVHPATISQVTPRASLEPLNFGLIAPFGGPLAVRKARPGAGDRSRANDGTLADYELVKPHFEMRAKLDAETSRLLADGEVGRVAVARGDLRSLGEVLTSAGRRWFDRLLEKAKVR